jgi:hypothetical protein
VSTATASNADAPTGPGRPGRILVAASFSDGAPFVAGALAAETPAAVGVVAGPLDVRVPLSGSDPSRRLAPLQEARIAVVVDLTGSVAVLVEPAVAPALPAATSDDAALPVALGG